MRWKKMTGYIMIGGMLLLAAVTGAGYGRKEKLQQELADKVLRFHVLANSDSTEDQELKLKVRNAVGGYMQGVLEGVKDLASCEAVVESHLPEIISVAEAEVKNNGYDYPVQAELKKTDFPVKTYGDYTFPSGIYEALEVTIGEGKGHNWWCVMYPNMCFQNSMYEVVDEEAGEALREVLTEEEYESVLRSGDYEIQFQYLSFLNQLFQNKD